MRTAFGRGMFAIALVAGVAGLTAACGGDGTTVSSTPSASAIVSPSASAAAPSASSSVAPTSSAVESTAPAEAPAPVPDGYPGPAAPDRTPRDQAFLDGLKAKNIAFSQNGDVALSAAQYICSAERDGTTPEQVRPMVLAIVASDAQLLDKQIDAEAVADVYIATAQATYCNA